MPIKEERQALDKKRERKLDLTRESKEAKIRKANQVGVASIT